MDDLVLEVLATLRLLVKKSAVDVRHVSSRLRWTSLAPRLQSSRDSASLRMISFFEASSSQSTSHDVNVSPSQHLPLKLRKGCPGGCECSKSRILLVSFLCGAAQQALYVVHNLGSVLLFVVLEIVMQMVQVTLHSQGHDMFVVDVFMVRGVVPPWSGARCLRCHCICWLVVTVSIGAGVYSAPRCQFRPVLLALVSPSIWDMSRGAEC